MAVAGIIAAAVGVTLLIIVAYLVVGGTITAAETVTSAQKDVTLQNEMRLGTAIAITDPVHNVSVITSNITNTGTEIISDFNHMDVIVFDTGSQDYQVCTYDAAGLDAPGTWNIRNRYQDFIHPFELDPGEHYQIQIITPGSSPAWFQITTGNGVYASAYV
jgi:archaeal flagellar protein FlaF